MKNKLNTLTIVILALFANLIPGNVRADPEAKELLERLKESESKITNTVDGHIVKEVEDFLVTKAILPKPTDDEWYLRSWPKDPDQENLLKYMFTLDLGWSLQVMPNLKASFWQALKNEYENGKLCGLRSLACDPGEFFEFFLEMLEKTQCLVNFSCNINSQEKLDKFAGVISKTNLETIGISSYYSADKELKITPIAKALLEQTHLGEIKLMGRFNVLPLFTMCDEVTIEYDGHMEKVKRFPQLGKLDLYDCDCDCENALAWLRDNPEQDLFLPRELVISSGSLVYTPSYVNFFKELISRGKNLEVLTIRCYCVGNEELKVLADMIKQNHDNGNHLCYIRHVVKGSLGNVNRFTEETLEYLTSALQASPFLMRLDLPGLSILGQKDEIYSPVLEEPEQNEPTNLNKIRRSLSR